MDARIPRVEESLERSFRNFRIPRRILKNPWDPEENAFESLEESVRSLRLLRRIRKNPFRILRRFLRNPWKNLQNP